MKERPILFSGPMVRALLAGTKTQTRRPVKPPPPSVVDVVRASGSDFSIFTDHRTPSVFRVAGPVWAVREMMGAEPAWRCPYGQPGDRLWVRETWALEACGEEGKRVIWQADRAAAWVLPGNVLGEIYYLPSDYKPDRWTPSIHMPRWASRLTLEVTEVRVQRLQEISEEDAKAEGLSSTPSLALPGRLLWRDYGLPEREKSEWFLDPRLSFQTLWTSINGERSPWPKNEWVWVVSFKVVSRG